MSWLKRVAKVASDAVLAPLGYEVRKKGKVRWEPIGLEDVIPPRELWVGPTDPLYWFFGYMWEYRAYLTLLCKMQRDASVLELGCSHGRTMLALLDYLEPPGRYEGLDIAPQKIDFAQQNIHSKYPLFNFTLADVYNNFYNPQGKHKASCYRFPYEDSWFDVVYAASLFTHLLPPDAANYFNESRRVMRKGGLCLFSFFLLDYYRGPGTSVSNLYEFDHPLDVDGAAIHNPAMPEQVIAYGIPLTAKMATQAGFGLKSIVPGFWSKTHKLGVNEQDLLLLEAV